MSVLRKKAQSGLDASTSSSDIFTPWQELQSAVCDFLAVALEAEVSPETGHVESGELKTLIKDMPETMISFSYGTSDASNMCLTAIAPSLAAKITETRLSQSNNMDGQGSDHDIGLLDLFLMRPCADIILDGVNVQISSLANPTNADGFHRTGQGLDLSEYQIDKSLGDWVKLTLPVKIKNEAETDAKPAKKTKPAKEKKMDDPVTDIPPGIILFLPKKLMDAISMAHNDNQIVPEFDPTGPWAIHMREAVGGAEVGLKAVLETCELSVAECTRLSIGQIIALPSVSLQAIMLETDTDGGTVELAQSSMGLYKSNKAVQLSEDILPTFISDLDTISI